MTTLTPKYNLVTYAQSGGDETSTFLNFRTDIAGVSNSNMTKIDTALAETLVVLKVFDFDETWILGDGAFYFPIPLELNEREIISVSAFCYTASSSSTPTVQIWRGRRATPTTNPPTWSQVLSTAITIDVNEYSSSTASVQPVVDSGNADLLTGDILKIDIDGIGTGTKGLDVSIKIG